MNSFTTNNISLTNSTCITKHFYSPTYSVQYNYLSPIGKHLCTYCMHWTVRKGHFFIKRVPYSDE